MKNILTGIICFVVLFSAIFISNQAEAFSFKFEPSLTFHHSHTQAYPRRMIPPPSYEVYDPVTGCVYYVREPYPVMVPPPPPHSYHTHSHGTDFNLKFRFK